MRLRQRLRPCARMRPRDVTGDRQADGVPTDGQLPMSISARVEVPRAMADGQCRRRMRRASAGAGCRPTCECRWRAVARIEGRGRRPTGSADGERPAECECRGRRPTGSADGERRAECEGRGRWLIGECVARGSQRAAVACQHAGSFALATPSLGSWRCSPLGCRAAE